MSDCPQNGYVISVGYETCLRGIFIAKEINDDTTGEKEVDYEHGSSEKYNK
jgi:hypothetical protein